MYDIVKSYVVKLHGDVNNDKDIDYSAIENEFSIISSLFYSSQITLISWSIQRQLRLFHNYFSKYLNKGFIKASLMKSQLMDLELLYWLFDSDYQERKAVEFNDICSYLKVPSVDLQTLWSNMDPVFGELLDCCMAIYVNYLC